jgi:hypothetical protein
MVLSVVRPSTLVLTFPHAMPRWQKQRDEPQVVLGKILTAKPSDTDAGAVFDVGFCELIVAVWSGRA